MPTQSSPRKDRAVNLVLPGEFDAKGAVAEVGLGARKVQRRSRYSRERKEGTRKAQRRGTAHRGDGEEEARETPGARLSARPPARHAPNHAPRQIAPPNSSSSVRGTIRSVASRGTSASSSAECGGRHGVAFGGERAAVRERREERGRARRCRHEGLVVAPARAVVHERVRHTDRDGGMTAPPREAVTSRSWCDEEVTGALNGPLGRCRSRARRWARPRWRPPAEATRSARRRRARARATHGASAAASRRPTEDIDRDLAAEVKARKESDARMTALLTERAASAAAE